MIGAIDFSMRPAHCQPTRRNKLFFERSNFISLYPGAMVSKMRS